MVVLTIRGMPVFHWFPLFPKYRLNITLTIFFRVSIQCYRFISNIKKEFKISDGNRPEHPDPGVEWCRLQHVVPCALKVFPAVWFPGKVISMTLKAQYRYWDSKVEYIFKGTLDSIPSPSTTVKIQILGGKVCLRCKGKTLLGVVNKLLNTKSLLTSPSNVLPYSLK